MNPSREVAQLLIDWSNGDKSALDELFPIVMGELRRRAHNALRQERPNHTLQTTALIHETYIKLAGYRRPPCRERGHFFAIAAQAMRYVLVQHARNHRRAKRNGIKVPFEAFDANAIWANNHIIEILALDEAFKTLGAIDPLKLRVAEMKVFAGSSNQEVAEALGISLNQATRYWQFARAYLAREIRRREYDA
jgi:RNA polymerase sigma factor (TIGR02999 family)